MHNTKSANNYLYKGKELQDNTGYYDFRQLDPALGRRFVQDALAEDYRSTSPYAYVKNNPINAVDIAGLVYMSTPIMASIGTKYAGTTDLLGFLGAGTSLGSSGPTGEDYDAFISMGGGGDGSSFSECYSLTGEDILRDVQWSLTGSMARAWFKKFFGKSSIDVGDPTFVGMSEEASPTIPPSGEISNLNGRIETGANHHSQSSSIMPIFGSPITNISSRAWPTNEELERRYAQSFKELVIDQYHNKFFGNLVNNPASIRNFAEDILSCSSSLYDSEGKFAFVLVPVQIKVAVFNSATNKQIFSKSYEGYKEFQTDGRPYVINPSGSYQKSFLIKSYGVRNYTYVTGVMFQPFYLF